MGTLDLAPKRLLIMRLLRAATCSRPSTTSRCFAWALLLSLTFSALFPGGSSLADEPIDLSQFLPFVNAPDLDDATASKDDATRLRPLERKQKCAYVTAGVASSFGAGSPSGVVSPAAVGISPVICKCLLGWTDQSEAAIRAALRSVSEGRRGGTVDVCPAVVTDVQFLS